jgi:hypothetical protein
MCHNIKNDNETPLAHIHLLRNGSFKTVPAKGPFVSNGFNSSLNPSRARIKWIQLVHWNLVSSEIQTGIKTVEQMMVVRFKQE